METEAEVTPPSRGERVVAVMKAACGYDEIEESGGVEALIAYKNALEDRLVAMLDAAGEAEEEVE